MLGLQHHHFALGDRQISSLSKLYIPNNIDTAYKYIPAATIDLRCIAYFDPKFGSYFTFMLIYFLMWTLKITKNCYIPLTQSAMLCGLQTDYRKILNMLRALVNLITKWLAKFN